MGAKTAEQEYIYGSACDFITTSVFKYTYNEGGVDDILLMYVRISVAENRNSRSWKTQGVKLAFRLEGLERLERMASSDSYSHRYQMCAVWGYLAVSPTDTKIIQRTSTVCNLFYS